MKTNVDINDLVQVPDTPLYQSRKTGDYFLRTDADAYAQISEEKSRACEILE